ncbi:MAG: flagellar hook-length control protein FliK [Roseburia sp.]|nr:flagellar hook-length control protein FliK [Roseburia sp.]
MHISDMLRQYNRNVSNGTEELRSAQGTQKLVSTIGELSAGSVFEGTVNSVKGGKVTLALGNGQVLTARLEGKVDMKPGTAMFFQVKSNDGLTVSIRPYSGLGNASNPILSGALTAAQVPVTERTLAMVDAMMQENMSVDRQSILDMVKILNANPESNVQTIVQMTKLGLPVTETMATQFENYLSDRHALLNEMELAVNQMAEVLSDEAMTPADSFALYSRIVDIFMTEDTLQSETAQPAAMAPQTAEQTAEQDAAGKATALQQDVASGGSVNLEGTQAARLAAIMGDGAAKMEVIWQGDMAERIQNASNPVSVETLGSLLSEEQLESLGKALQEVPTLTGNSALFVNGNAEEIFVDTMQDDTVVVSEMLEPETADEAQIATKMILNKDMPVSEFLRTLQGALSENGELGFSGVQRLFAGKEFQMLLRNMVEQQWLIKPQDLKEEQRMTKLYEKMNRQMAQVESAMKTAGITQNSFLQTAADIRGNIEFMNQMNQIYNYVQIPLKMSGQNANGELYVYTNKKQLSDPEAELTAFLHLDMENLGETDVSVRMKDKQVKTNFYFEDDTSYDLVEKHLPILEKRLRSKGYNCTITITNEKRDVNFKENFVKKGKVSAGSVHRYSFDVRA